MTNFWQRTITGIIFISVVMGSIWAGSSVFTLVFLGVSIGTLLEFYRLMRAENIQPNIYVGLIVGVLAYMATCGTIAFPFTVDIATLVVPAIAAIFFAELYRKHSAPMLNISVTLMGIIYAVIPFALLVKTAFIQDANVFNRGLVLGVFILIWSNDTFAYLVGSKFGKTRLFERISPKKSWEGSVGGVVFTFGTAWVMYHYNPEIGLINWMVIALLICVAGTLGDLVESLMKRSLGVKDSGNILPGHGGWLDRFDAVLLSVPFVWSYLHLVTGV
jgi:phosphatidate cytidylyltransferase